MKKLVILLLCCILLLTGCSGNKITEATIPQTSPEATTQTFPVPVSEEPVPEVTEPDSTELLSVAVPADRQTYALEDGTELYSYTAQHMELILPNEMIADRVILDFLNRVDAAQMDAENVLNAARNDYNPESDWFPYFYQILYSPTRIDHGVLSLFGTQSSYSGGTHGTHSCVSANYDLSTGDILTLGSIMHMDASKEDFIEIILEKLNENADGYQLFDGYEEGVRNRLGGDENLYEDFFFTTTGLSFFFAPYEIAPYASGIITVEIPYEELPGLIYDGYFPAERDQNHGQMLTGSFMDTDMEQFHNMAEINLREGEDILVAYPTGEVKDIRVIVAGNDLNMPEYTVFMAYEMSDANAVVISLAKEDIEKVSITYSSDGKQETIPLA